MLIWLFILRSIAAPFLFGTTTIVVLFVVQYIIPKIEDLLSKGLEIEIVAEFLLLSMSWSLVLAVPVGILFASVMAFGALSSNHEVTVYKASGMGLVRMMFPAVIVGAALSACMLWYTDAVLPDTNHRLAALISDIGRMRPAFAVEAGRFTTHLDGLTILARDRDSAGTLYGVTIYDRSRTDRLMLVNADTAVLGFTPTRNRMMLQLYHGEIHQRSERAPNDYRVTTFVRHQMLVNADRFFFEPTDATGTSRGEREMNIADMQAIVDRSKASMDVAARTMDSVTRSFMLMLAGTEEQGMSDSNSVAEGAVMRARATHNTYYSAMERAAYQYDSDMKIRRNYEVEIQKKYAIPAACLLFVLLGCPLGIVTKGGNFGVSAAISLGFYVLSWSALIGGEKLADRGHLDPTLAMWLGNILLFIIGVALIVRVNYEISVWRFVMGWFTLRPQNAVASPNKTV